MMRWATVWRAVNVGSVTATAEFGEQQADVYLQPQFLYVAWGFTHTDTQQSSTPSSTPHGGLCFYFLIINPKQVQLELLE